MHLVKFCHFVQGRQDNLYDILFLKNGLLEKVRICSIGEQNKFLPFKVGPSSEGRQNTLTEFCWQKYVHKVLGNSLED